MTLKSVIPWPMEVLHCKIKRDIIVGNIGGAKTWNLIKSYKSAGSSIGAIWVFANRDHFRRPKLPVWPKEKPPKCPALQYCR